MQDGLLFFAILISLAVGFFLGIFFTLKGPSSCMPRGAPRGTPNKKSKSSNIWTGFRSAEDSDAARPHIWPQRKYFEGLTYLLNDQPDQAIDTFVSVMDVNSETLETHLALGNLLRKRGELARAVKVHQNLLARPSLPPQQLHRVQLELAVDYVRSGLLDRAEMLLKELIDLRNVEPQTHTKAIEYLIEIYQDMGDWLQAIDAADRLTTSKFSFTPDKWRTMQSHFACELANIAQRKKDWQTARRWLRDAVRYDKGSARALISSAEIHIADNDYAAAINSLRKVAQLHPQYTANVLPYICQCFDALHDSSGLLQELQQLYTAQPSIVLLQELADRVALSESKAAAVKLWLKELPNYYDMEAALELIQVLVAYSEPIDEQYAQIRSALQKMIAATQGYECSRCGFFGQELHWLCPSCKRWGCSFPRVV